MERQYLTSDADVPADDHGSPSDDMVMAASKRGMWDEGWEAGWQTLLSNAMVVQDVFQMSRAMFTSPGQSTGGTRTGQTTRRKSRPGISGRHDALASCQGAMRLARPRLLP